MTTESTETEQEKRLNAGRTIDVGVHKEKTMTRHRMGYKGKLNFTNPTQWPLVIKTDAGRPFRVSGCADPVDTFTVAADSNRTVMIDEDFKGLEIVYTAKIGDYPPEDPIIILDRD